MRHEQKCEKCGNVHLWQDTGEKYATCYRTNYRLHLNHAGGVVDCTSPEELEREFNEWMIAQQMM